MRTMIQELIKWGNVIRRRNGEGWGKGDGGEKVTGEFSDDSPGRRNFVFFACPPFIRPAGEAD